MSTCHICNNDHVMVSTPFPDDFIHCPYDASGKSLYPWTREYMIKNKLSSPIQIDPNSEDWQIALYAGALGGVLDILEEIERKDQLV